MQDSNKKGDRFIFNILNRHLPNLATLPFSANGHGLSPSMSEETQTMGNSNNTLPGWMPLPRQCRQ
jgi:hypothetical protein